ncbi:hypothetical protein R1sor_005626 [Riccia sorocarpa]|uniref:Reverse transcriptase domain-containing protein n=1 Tax=Riccia sorocarpa TaxID=122646 RepID=A0ABD3HNY9_9MARC
MNFDGKFIQLLQGLLEGVSSVVHLNGAFTKDIELQQGVRQGCPIAPLLFSLSTQPLMLLLREAQVQGQVQGLEVGNMRTILEALFADDIGLLLRAEEDNWRKATEVVKRFEKISGAKLNVSKSLVISIGFSEPPSWLIASGCKLALLGEVYTYLGCPIGVELTEEQSLQFLLDKLIRKLHYWANRLLSWESRVVLTKHWKVANTNSRWKELGWHPSESLLLGNAMRLADTPTLNRMLEGWWSSRRWLNFKGTPKDLPASTTTEQFINIAETWWGMRRSEVIQARKLFKKAELTDCCTVNAGKLNELELLDRGVCRSRASMQPSIPEGPLSRIISLWCECNAGSITRAPSLADNRLWQWERAGKNLEGCLHSTREWRWLWNSKKPLESKWNHEWDTAWEDTRWKQFWTAMWASKLSPHSLILDFGAIYGILEGELMDY